MSMLKAFFDDSGTHDASDVVLWGGLIGRDDQWADLSANWREQLETERFGLSAPYYHRAEVMGIQGAFFDWKRPALDNLTYDLRRVLLEAGVSGFAAATFKSVWRELVRPPLDHILKTPEAFCFSECIRWAREWSATFAGGAEVALFFNEDRREEAIRQSREVQSYIHGGLGEVHFLPAKPHPEIQAADMVAGEIWRDAVNWRADGDARLIGPHLRPLIESGRFSAGVADREIIHGWTTLFSLGVPPDLPEALWPSVSG